ncbi:MAG: YwmB family TATA-box binding protein [Firmicutes bacterium]|nr:YwmB family TATA-box binding protein [Bacillota bacterium]
MEPMRRFILGLRRYLKVSAGLGPPALALLLLLRLSPALAGQAQEHPVWQAFAASGATLLDTEISAWSVLARDFLDFPQLKSRYEQVARALELDPALLPLEATEEAGFRQLQAQGRRPDGTRVVITLQSLDRQVQPGRVYPPEAYLTVRLLQEGPPPLLSREEERLRQAAAGIGRAQVYITLTGALLPAAAANGAGAGAEAEPRMSEPRVSTLAAGRAAVQAVSAPPSQGSWQPDLRNRLAWDMLRRVDAQVTDWLADRNVLSVTAYTPRLRQRLQLGRKAVNLNIALRSAEDGRQLYVVVGSPLIVGEY